MKNLKSAVVKFINDEEGLSAVEYAIAGGLVVAGMVAVFTTIGTGATGKLQELSDAVN